MKQDARHSTHTQARLTQLLRQAGCAVDASQALRLLHHLDLVLEHNEYVNLTRITEVDAALRLHIVDSLAWLPLLRACESPAVDIGSGAGFPGLPLAIVGDVDVVLCESVRKKADFLRMVAAEVAPAVEVFNGRAEELALARPGFAGTVTARAVSSLPALVELASPLLREQGRLVALKGRLTAGEVADGDAAAATCGMTRTAMHSYVLAEGGEERTVVEFTRTGRASIHLPRRPGQAQRTPIVSE